MTRVLIVEDNATFTRALERTLRSRAPELSIVTSSDGVEATELLGSQEFDFVITDLQMPRMDGFELLAWLLTHRPALPVFAITGYASDATFARLQALGAVECFTKPIDVKALLSRIRSTLAQSIRGHVEHVSLASFLQLIEMERKTCTLTVRSNGNVGVLFVKLGQLQDARTGTMTGEDAAISIVGWPDVGITIVNQCPTQERVIETPLGFIIMEGLRVQDEAVRRTPSECLELVGPSRPTEASQIARRRSTAPPSSGAGAPLLPLGARALSVVDTATGDLRAWTSSDGVPIAALATLSAVALREEVAVLESCGQRDELEEVVVTTRSECYVIRPFRESMDQFAMLVFAREEMSLVMARIHLDRFLAERPAAVSGPRTS